MTEKTVTYNVTGTIVTVTVTDAPPYLGISAVVTAKLLPNGPITPPNNSEEVNMAGVFTFPPLTPGQYLISVDCGGKLFGRVVDVPPTEPPSNTVTFHFTDTATLTGAPPKVIGPLLPTVAELQALGLLP